jgi:hypothetical protein
MGVDVRERREKKGKKERWVLDRENERRKERK